MPSHTQTQKKPKPSNLQSKHLVLELKKQIIKLQKENAKLKSDNFTLLSELKILRKEHAKCNKAPYDFLLSHMKSSKKK
jgi:hypothetical protein